jgi:hypothetical protein
MLMSTDCKSFLRSCFFALLLVRFFPVLPLTFAAAVLGQPTLPAFEETVFERLCEHVAIGTHLPSVRLVEALTCFFRSFNVSLE